MLVDAPTAVAENTNSIFDIFSTRPLSDAEIIVQAEIVAQDFPSIDLLEPAYFMYGQYSLTTDYSVVGFIVCDISSFNELCITEGYITPIGLSANGLIFDPSFELIAMSTVPVPATVWLFGSGFLSLIGVARRQVPA